MELNNFMIKPIVERALREDIGNIDITTISCISKDMRAKAVIRVKEKGVLAGMPLVKLVYELLDPAINVQVLQSEGQEVEPGTTVAEVVGPARAILTGERVALNFLQRLSGIATKTKKLVDMLQFYDCHITDTRKTTPGLRDLQKYAITVGGGIIHRFNLSDSLLIKDNHIKICGDIKSAIAKARRNIGHTTKIEVEVNTLEQVNEALEAGIDIILLDNMQIEDIKEAVDIIGNKAIVEASGNITDDMVLDVARTGVRYIALGSLTHSYQSLDISLDIAYGDK